MELFDTKFYYNLYKDTHNLFLKNNKYDGNAVYSILYQHYLEIGSKEGRAKNLFMLQNMFSFNNNFYRSNFSDLNQPGLDLFRHFINHGFDEFRNCTTDKILNIENNDTHQYVLLLNCPFFVNTQKTRNITEYFKKIYIERWDNENLNKNIKFICSNNILVVKNIIRYCKIVIYLSNEKNYNFERLLKYSKQEQIESIFINNIYQKESNVTPYKSVKDVINEIQLTFSKKNNFELSINIQSVFNTVQQKEKSNLVQIVGLKFITCSISQNIQILKKNFKDCVIKDAGDFKKGNIDYSLQTIICIQPTEILLFRNYLDKFLVKPSVFWVCEFDEINQEYLDLQNYFEEVLVPTDFCYRVFSKYLDIPVEKIKYESIIHEYLDQIEEHKIDNKKILNILESLDGYDKYGYCFDCNSSLTRKNILNLVKAFQDFPDKKLILKFRKKRDDNVFSENDTKIYHEFINIIQNCDNIFYIDDEISNLDLYKLYTYFDYYISPHLGEGYGLTIYDNMILGNKIISPFITGETEYLDKDLIIELPITIMKEQNEIPYTITQESIELSVNNREIISSKYFEKYQENSNNIQGKKIILIISLFDCTNIQRLEELKTVLNINLMNCMINKICILYERNTGSLDYLSNHNKIDLIILKKRPTFNDYFNISNEKYQGDICMVANSDVFFNTDLYKIKNIQKYLEDRNKILWHSENEEIFKNCIFTLTRYNIINLEKSKHDIFFINKTYQIDYDYMRNHASQDVWIFKSPIKLLNTDIMIGTFTSDSFLNAQIINMGYNYYNISNILKCFHLQKEISDSQINTSKKNDVDINKNKIVSREEYYTDYVNKIRDSNQRLSVVGINHDGKYFYPVQRKSIQKQPCLNKKKTIYYHDNQVNKFLKVQHCYGCYECSWNKFFPQILLDLDKKYAENTPNQYNFKNVYNFKGIDIPIQKNIISDSLQHITKIYYFNTKSNLFEELSFTLYGKDKLIFDNVITTNHIKIWYQNIMKLDIENENFIKYNDFNIIISGIGKNIASFIPKLKENITFINYFFPQNKIFIYENDSTDNSVELLKKYFGSDEFLAENNKHSDDLSQYQNIARARKKCRDFINSQPDSEYPYIFLIDTDLHYNLYMTNIQKAFENINNYDVQFANGIYLDKYYWDTFALRTYERNIPFYEDIDTDGVNKYWKEVTNIPEVQIQIEKQFTEVVSAFGGMALYKKECFRLADYNVDIIDCEHVPFHEELSRLGKKIVINRDFIKKYSFDETIGGYYHPLEWKNSKVVKKKNKN